MLRHRWWLAAVLAITLLVIGGAVAWDKYTLRGSRETVSVTLDLRRHGNGLASISVRHGRLSDPGSFAQRVAALLMPMAHQSPIRIYHDLLDHYDLIDVPVAGLPAPVRLDTHTLQQALATLGFRRLEVGLTSAKHRQVVPHSTAQAGSCWGRALSCNWGLAIAGPPLKAEIRPA